MKTTIKSIAVALAFCAAAFLTVSAIIENTAPNGSEKYIMRDYNGRIAVFVYGEDEPQEVFDVFTSSLPRGEAAAIAAAADNLISHPENDDIDWTPDEFVSDWNDLHRGEEPLK